MLNGKTFLAVIPARGGSKRLPRKNVLDLAGKPLIGWSIEAAQKSKYLDALVVSSDDSEILELSKNYGAETLLRPQELASDTATTFDTLKHVIENSKEYDYIVLLQPTSPLRTAQDIDEAIKFLINKDAEGIISVCEMEHSPLWSNTLSEDKSMEHFLKEEVLNKRSQDLETYYRLNGAIYIAKIDKFLENGSFFLKNNIFAYEMPQQHSIDIDTKIDFLFAELLLKEQNG
ncbi:cytidylyltransferase domain-containing protein [Sulfurimonas microaerophilic]|uniref:acylneuraminate cytidylyltransferase family protein n=1 Tax=Sulfurimonas microaerophilic TaxID=3058392 RepID=UPI00271537DC|nr:acylneuraminate cytidylyltransferase family protein [Sulfurimonas sp. hsl 1-7]